MQSQFKILLMSASVVALGACSGPNSSFTDTFNSEAGSQVDMGDFGNATMTNTMIMTNPASYAIDLTRKFMADVPNTVNFEFDSAVLDGEAQAALRRQADWIKQFPEIRFRVYGHTDLVGPDGYNRGLGLRRAQAVVAYLVGQGISRSRLEAVASYGETQPLVATQDRERQNRRTVTEVSGFVEKNPALLHGKYAAIIFREYVASAVGPHEVVSTLTMAPVP